MYKILSVGGSIIISKTGFDIKFLKQFRNLILTRVKKGEKFILVTGGGAICRNYQAAAKSIANLSDIDLDWLGIFATQFNAQFVRLLFGKYAHPNIILNPTNKLITNKSIIVSGGWKIGCSTDRDAILLAKTYSAKEVINLSNIDYVYSSDPKINTNAKKYSKLTWKEFRKIIDSKWVPGANLPFDQLAAKEAEKLKIKVKFVKGTALREVDRAIRGQAFAGTIIN